MAHNASGHPQIAVRVARHCAHQIAAQSVRLGKGLHARSRPVCPQARPVRQPAPRANPQRTIGVRQQRADEVVRQPIGRGEGVNLAPANAVEAVGRAHPEIAVGRRSQRQNHVAEQAVAYGVVLDMRRPSGLRAARHSARRRWFPPRACPRRLPPRCGCVGSQPLARADACRKR